MANPIFKRIADAKASAGGNNMRDGKYTLVIMRIEFDRKFKGQTFILELLVVKSENLPDVIDEKGKPVLANAPGTTCSCVWNIDTNVAAAGNVKSFILTLNDQDESSFNDAEAEAAALGQPSPFELDLAAMVGPGQLARGVLIGAETYRKVTRGGPNQGKVGVYPNWHHIAQSGAAIARRRALMDKAQLVSAPTPADIAAEEAEIAAEKAEKNGVAPQAVAA